MKKPLLVLLLCLCCAPCFSQGVKAGLQGVEAGVKGVSAAGQIEKNLAQQVRRACAASQVRLAQITNMPGQPTVQVRVDASVPVSSAAVLQARMLPSRQVYQSISSVLSRRPYLPSAFTETKDVLYRGMRLTQLSDLENILRQGLEIRRTGYSELYFAYAPSMALTYALPRSINEKEAGDFPVVVKVPITTQLPVSCTGVNAQAYKDLPAEFISDVMVFLEIDGHADWYKAILENDKLLLIPVPTTHMPGYFPVAASVDNLPGKPTLPTLLGQNELYRIRMRWGNTFPSPFEDDRSAAFYRGMHLNNFEDVRNMLINGLEIKASPRGIIYTTRRPSLAVTFAVAPIQEGEFPALIRIPVTQELLRTNPPNETNAWYQSTFYQDIPSKMLEIFAFLEIDKQVGWYQITLTADNQLNFTFVENKRLLPIFEEDM